MSGRARLWGGLGDTRAGPHMGRRLRGGWSSGEDVNRPPMPDYRWPFATIAVGAGLTVGLWSWWPLVVSVLLFGLLMEGLKARWARLYPPAHPRLSILPWGGCILCDADG